MPASKLRYRLDCRSKSAGTRSGATAAAGEPAGLIATKPPGYSLEVEPGQLDSREFETGAASARASAAEGDLVEAVANARSALSLWRGSAWDGIPSHSVQAESTRLEERRLGLIEDCLQWDLILGRHHEVIGELITLTAEQPLRERFHLQLMLALYRDGRQAQALEAFQLARNAFQRELGLDPGDELQRLQHAILTHDPNLAAPESKERSAQQTTSIARKPMPLQLPRDLDDFACAQSLAPYLRTAGLQACPHAPRCCRANGFRPRVWAGTQGDSCPQTCPEPKLVTTDLVIHAG